MEYETINRLTVNYQNKPCYDIVYAEDFNELAENISALELSFHSICIVSDSNVAPLYADSLKEQLSKLCEYIEVFTFKAGEESKTLDTVKALYEFLIQNKFERKDLLIALGGGVVGDLCGYTAATYLRGIDFIQIPTTLLSQVDSSIGGKTGVDFDQYKNMVGAFKMPRLVYTNLSCLKTLDDRQFYSGMGEVLKHGLIKDAKYYEWLINHFYEIGTREIDYLKPMVYQINVIKKAVVEKYPLEKGDRALLNFGHTIGHAIEKYKNFELAHGECVALGCVAAAYISYKKNLLSTEEYYEIRDMFVPFELPITIDDIDPEAILSLTKSDKKMSQGKIKFILLKKVGKAYIDTDVTDEEIRAGIKEIYFNEDEMDNE